MSGNDFMTFSWSVYTAERTENIIDILLILTDTSIEVRQNVKRVQVDCYARAVRSSVTLHNSDR